MSKPDIETMRLAFEHGKIVGQYLMSNLPVRYAPYTFERWYALTFETEENEDISGGTLKISIL